uniref:DNA-directed RNA polymerase II subunit J n=1 Tax=Tetraselmis sp. GSL018 TaxID=582737 RepID=A0A061RGP8_9CHLO|mmetsp:Transcript_40962/g.97325  ORF Transcript_40962/g.97325 Transcript_40962/m.97325 type:complete len:117 (+) Transcript_40962:154-504(+)
MNQPARYEKFIIPDGQEKVKYEKDTKVRNAATFTIEREDHTIGNIVRMQLHTDKDVVFAGYRVPHPLEHKLEIKIQTTGNITPIDALSTAVSDLRTQLMDIQTQFEIEADKATMSY